MYESIQVFRSNLTQLKIMIRGEWQTGFFLYTTREGMV